MTTKEMTRATGDAVVAYRKLVQAEFDLEQLRAEVGERASTFPIDGDEWRAYVEATEAIDRAADETQSAIDAHGWSRSTAKTQFRQATNRAGRG